MERKEAGKSNQFIEPSLESLEPSLEIDLNIPELDLDSIEELDGTALGAILQELYHLNRDVPGRGSLHSSFSSFSMHDSHSSHSSHSSTSWAG